MRAAMRSSSLRDASDGRGSKIRTCDPLLPKQVRYQAALCPDHIAGSWPTRTDRTEARRIHNSRRSPRLVFSLEQSPNGAGSTVLGEARIDDLVAALQADLIGLRRHSARARPRCRRRTGSLWWRTARCCARCACTVPSGAMNTMSSGISVFFIHMAAGCGRVVDEQHAGILRQRAAKHQTERAAPGRSWPLQS